jgi:predicted dithiol-disulfide oxidoreductase (DUF899 family)
MTIQQKIVSRDEWLAARLELLEQEKEFTHRRDELSARRRDLPLVRIDKPYVFHGPDGDVRLVDLFDGCPQLFVHHFMWLDDQHEGCPSCSAVVDNFEQMAVHLKAVNTAMAFTTRAPIDEIEAFRKRMGWSIPLYSSLDNDFNYDFHVTIDRSRGAVEYNYRDVTKGGMWEAYEGDLAAESVFLRDGDDVFHSYTTYARGTESTSSLFGILDFTPMGRQEEAGIQNWIRHHDRYE